MSALDPLRTFVDADILLTVRRRSALLLATATASCSEPMTQNSSAPAPAARPASLLSPEERKTSPLTQEWLVGYWAYEGAGCGPGMETSLWPDGTYTMGDGSGRWALSGSTLTIAQETAPSISYMQVRLGDPGPSTVRKHGPNEMQVDWAGGIEAGGAGGRFIRCN